MTRRIYRGLLTSLKQPRNFFLILIRQDYLILLEETP